MHRSNIRTRRAEAPDLSRRRLLQAASVTALGAAAAGAPGTRAWAQGSDAPEKKEVQIGFIPLTDCASVVMASVLGFDKKYGIKIIPTKEASWAGVRDKLVNGELDAAHVLYGLIYGVQLGVGGPKKDMAVLMNLNHNGQAITLSNKLADKGAVDGASAGQALIDKEKREYTFAQTFPTGTHAMWLYYWLAAHGINPIKRRQDRSPCRRRRWWPTCASATWTASASASRGTTAPSSTRSASPPSTTQDIWKDHPGEGARHHRRVRPEESEHRARDDRWPCSKPAAGSTPTLPNKRKMAEIVADKSYVNTAVDVIDQRILGRYDNGIGKTWDDPNHMKFYNDGAVNFPYLSDGMWFLTQHKRWGLLKDRPGLPGRRQAGQPDRALQAGRRGGRRSACRRTRCARSKLIDGVVWDGKDPKPSTPTASRSSA